MIQLLTHISEHCSTIFIWPDQSIQKWCQNGTFISSCQPCYDLPFPMVQSIDPAMTSLAKNGGRWKQHYCCCWLLPGGDPILNLNLNLCVSTCLFIWGFVQNKAVVNLLSHAGFLAKNHMPNQALQWIPIPGITHLNPDEPERMSCWKSDVNTYLVCRCGYACDQWTVFHSTWDKFCLGGLAEGAKATTVLRTYYGDTRAPSQCKDRLPQVWGFPC